MFKRIRRHITFTGLIAALALFFAMSGGAWAVSKYVITSTNQIKPSVLTQLEQGFPETLPPGKTLKGTWSVGQVNTLAENEPLYASISLGIPLASSPTVIFLKEGEEESPETIAEVHNCAGSAAAPIVTPNASGQTVVCVFTSTETNWTVARTGAFAVTGANNKSPNKQAGEILLGKNEATGVSRAYGTWAAMTAE